MVYREYDEIPGRKLACGILLSKLSSLHLQRLYKKLLTGGRVERIEFKKQLKGLSAKAVGTINQAISSAMDFLPLEQ